MDIDEQAEENDDLLVNFFPSTQLQSIRSVEGSVNLLVIHQMAQERLPSANNALGYVVELVNRYGNERLRMLKYNKGYVKSRVSKKMQDALNETRQDGVERFFKLEKALRTNTIAVIMVTPRDVALLYYRFPEELFASLSYRITVYDGSDGVLRTRILEYMERVLEYNNTELFSPLALVLPIMADDLDDPLMVLFVAISDDRVVGFCGCNILRYRMEIRGLLDEAIRSLHTDDKKLKERFFMNETLSHVFEIKGLSVDQKKGGMNIALMLLYCAMDFMREPRIHKIYPISHVATQAASYITKRLLVTSSNFHFVYHGKNEFFNEGFFETLEKDKKTLLTRVITECLGYYRILITNRAETLSTMLYTHNKLAYPTSPYLTVIRDAINIYQLYYLLLATTVRPGSHDCFTSEALESVVNLFKLFITTLPSKLSVYAPLRNYLESNIAALRMYHAKREIDALYSVVHTKGDDVSMSSYGFLEKTEKGKQKEPINSAYEFIYTSITNTAKLMHVLVTKHAVPIVIEIGDGEEPAKIVVDTEVTEMKKYLTQLLRLTNGLIEDDLAQETNYTIPLEQLGKIRKSIATLISTLKRTAFNDVPSGVVVATEQPMRLTIQEILKSIDKKILFVGRNYEICAILTNIIFNVDPLESPGFDTFISYNRLAQHWPVVQTGVHQRVGYNTTIMEEEGIDDDENDEDGLAMAIEEVPTLEIPDSAEKRKELLNKLYELLVRDPPKESEVLFGDRVWPVAYLTEYFRELSVVDDISSLTETQKEDSDITTTFAYLYDYDAFDRAIEDLDDDSVFNNAFI